MAFGVFLMTRRNDTAIARMAVVLIPVIAGGIIGIMSSIITNYYTFRIEQKYTIRKERMANIERAMTLTEKYSNDVSKVLALGFIIKGNATPHDVAILTAPMDTLMELNVVISLYFPQLRSDIEQLIIAHGAMMKRYDDITNTNNEHSGEGANDFSQRIQKEVAPAMGDVHSLMKKLSELAQRDDT